MPASLIPTDPSDVPQETAPVKKEQLMPTADIATAESAFANIMTPGEVASAMDGTDRITQALSGSIDLLRQHNIPDRDIASFMIRNYDELLKKKGFSEDQIQQYIVLKNAGYPDKWVKDPTEPAGPAKPPVPPPSAQGTIGAPPEMPPGKFAQIWQAARYALDPHRNIDQTERFSEFLHAFDPALNPAVYGIYKLINGALLDPADIVHAIGKKAGLMPDSKNFEEELLRDLDYHPSALFDTVLSVMGFVAAGHSGGKLPGIASFLKSTAGRHSLATTATREGLRFAPLGALKGLAKAVNEAEQGDMANPLAYLVPVVGEAAKYTAGIGAATYFLGGAGRIGTALANTKAGKAAKGLWQKALNKTVIAGVKKITEAPAGTLRRDFMNTVGPAFSRYYGMPDAYKARVQALYGTKVESALQTRELVEEFRNITKNLHGFSGDKASFDTLNNFFTGKAGITSIPKELRGWAAEVKAVKRQNSLDLADYWEQMGNKKLADGIRKNADTYLPVRYKAFEKGFWRQVFRPKYGGGEFKMRRDAWVAYEGKTGLGKFKTLDKLGESVRSNAVKAYEDKIQTLTPQIEKLQKAIANRTSTDLVADQAKLTDLLGKRKRMHAAMKKVSARIDAKLKEMRGLFRDRTVSNLDAKIARLEGGEDKAALANLKLQRENALAEMSVPEHLPPDTSFSFKTSNKTYTIKPPISIEEKEALGQIHDTAYLVADALTRGKTDIANFQFLDNVSQQYAKTPPGDFTTQDIKNWALSAGLKRIPSTTAYGALAGKYVPERIAKDIIGQFGPEASSLVQKIWQPYLRLWKMAHIVFNPATHGRNIIGNVVFADLGDISVFDSRNWRYYRQSIKELSSKGKVYHNMLKHNVIGTEYFQADIKPYFRYADDIEKTGPVQWLLHSGSDIATKSKAIYAVEDQIYKTAAYLKYTAEGMTPLQAAAKVNYWYPNYRLLSPASSVWAKNPMGAPFIAFTDQAAKIAARAAYEHPARLAKWILLPKMMTEFSTWYLGMSPQERQLVDMNRNAFVPLIPFRDKEGRVLTWDLRWTIPLANDLMPTINRTGVDVPWAFKGPLMDAITQLSTGVNPFTNRPVTNEERTLGQKIRDHLFAGAQTLAPLPSIAMFGPKRIFKALGDKSEETLTRAVTGTLLGLNFRMPYIEREKLLHNLRDKILSKDLNGIAETIALYNRIYRTEKQPPITTESISRSLRYTLLQELRKATGIEKTYPKK